MPDSRKQAGHLIVFKRYSLQTFLPFGGTSELRTLIAQAVLSDTGSFEGDRHTRALAEGEQAAPAGSHLPAHQHFQDDGLSHLKNPDRALLGRATSR